MLCEDKDQQELIKLMDIWTSMNKLLKISWQLSMERLLGISIPTHNGPIEQFDHSKNATAMHNEN